jgi:hypothetical protein
MEAWFFGGQLVHKVDEMRVQPLAFVLDTVVASVEEVVGIVVVLLLGLFLLLRLVFALSSTTTIVLLGIFLLTPE